MTQALLNNLNILKDTNFSVSDNSAKVDVKDFEKILDTKTNFDNSKNNNAELKTDNSKNENINNNQKTQTSQTSEPAEQKVKTTSPEDSQKTIGDIKNQKQETDLAEEIDNSIRENAVESVIDLIINEEDSEIADTKTEINDEDNTVQQETDENITQETNITEEDLTMYKETNAPENPTTVLLMSQIQTNVKLPVHENTEKAEQETVTLRTNDDNQEPQVIKKFDDMLSKDLPGFNNSAKDTAGSKTEQSKQPTALNEKMVKELNIESVNAETTQNSTSGDLMQNQTPQEQTVKIMIQGDIKPDFKTEIPKAVEVKPVEITPSKIIEQITKQLDGMYNNSKLEMVLNPGTLGKLHLHLMNTKDGLIAQFTVTTQEARDILMKGLNGLKEALLAQGINIEDVSVKFEDSESENTFDWTEQEGSRGGNKQQGARKQKEQEKPFEQMMFEMENDDNLV